MTYTVGDRDTLTSVAARFDTTPSELTSINRLVGSFVYPGQQLLVPDKDKLLEGSETASDKSSPVNGSRDNLQDEKGKFVLQFMCRCRFPRSSSHGGILQSKIVTLF